VGKARLNVFKAAGVPKESYGSYSIKLIGVLSETSYRERVGREYENFNGF
jgi:hypothetical protein